MTCRVERIELDDPIVGKGQDALVAGLRRELGQPARRVDGVVIVIEQGAVFLDGASRIAELLGEAAHDRVRAVRTGRHRHQRRGLLERLERRLVALLGQGRAEGELRAIASRPIRRGRLERRDVAALTLVAGLGRLGPVPQRRAQGAEALVQHLVEGALQLVDGDAEALADGGVAFDAVAVDSQERAQRRLAARGDDVLDEQRRLVVRERDRVRLGEARIQIAQLQGLPALERERERHFHVAAPRRLLAAFFVDRDALGQPARHALIRHLQCDDVRELVPERRLPRERPGRLGLRRVHAHDAPEAGAERADEAGETEVADREVVVDRKNLDEDWPFGRELVRRR